MYEKAALPNPAVPKAAAAAPACSCGGEPSPAPHSEDAPRAGQGPAQAAAGNAPHGSEEQGHRALREEPEPQGRRKYILSRSFPL